MTEEPLRREIVSKAFAITPFVQADSLLITFFPNLLRVIGEVKSSAAIKEALSTNLCVA
jgi:hypothetical protein